MGLSVTAALLLHKWVLGGGEEVVQGAAPLWVLRPGGGGRKSRLVQGTAPQGTLIQAPQRAAGKPGDRELRDPAESPGALPVPSTGPGPPAPSLGLLVPASQSHTILVCPDADRAQLECGHTHTHTGFPGPPSRPLWSQPPGPWDGAGPRRSGLALCPSLAEDARGATIFSPSCSFLCPAGSRQVLID